VIGSESLETVAVLKDIMAEASGRMVLSLDFHGDEFMGPQALLDDVSLWPPKIIVMTLSRVGGDEGPDLARIGDIGRRAGGRRVYAAGGVRDRADLDAISAAGACGALMASALHDKKITAGDLKEIAGR
jgi:phosphoribosylformimino-5-aminoimidazole carboxamide ribotide isomerase